MKINNQIFLLIISFKITFLSFLLKSLDHSSSQAFIFSSEVSNQLFFMSQFLDLISLEFQKPYLELGLLQSDPAQVILDFILHFIILHQIKSYHIHLLLQLNSSNLKGFYALTFIKVSLCHIFAPTSILLRAAKAFYQQCCYDQYLQIVFHYYFALSDILVQMFINYVQLRQYLRIKQLIMRQVIQILNIIQSQDLQQEFRQLMQVIQLTRTHLLKIWYQSFLILKILIQQYSMNLSLTTFQHLVEIQTLEYLLISFQKVSLIFLFLSELNFSYLAFLQSWCPFFMFTPQHFCIAQMKHLPIFHMIILYEFLYCPQILFYSLCQHILILILQICFIYIFIYAFIQIYHCQLFLNQGTFFINLVDQIHCIVTLRNMITYYPDEKGLFTFYKEQQQTILVEKDKKKPQGKHKKQVKKRNGSIVQKAITKKLKTEGNQKSKINKIQRRSLESAQSKHFSFLKSVLYDNSRTNKKLIEQKAQIQSEIHKEIQKQIKIQQNSLIQFPYSKYDKYYENQLLKRGNTEKQREQQVKNDSAEQFRILNQFKKKANFRIETEHIERTNQSNQFFPKRPIEMVQIRLPPLISFQKISLRKKNTQNQSLPSKNIPCISNEKYLNIVLKDQKLIPSSPKTKKKIHQSAKVLNRPSKLDLKQINIEKSQSPKYLNLSHKIMQQNIQDWTERKKTFLKKLGIRI